MPIPKPRKGDNQQAFVSRCMGNNAMVKDYPNQGQRSAVCYQSWNQSTQKRVIKKR